MRRWVAAAAVLTSLCWVATCTADGQTRTLAVAPTDRTPRILTESVASPQFPEFARRPPGIVYSGDGSAELAGAGTGPVRPPAHLSSRLAWDSWTSTEARGSGADWHDNCVPDCATGTYYPFAATLRAYRPRRFGGYLLFTRLTVTYTGARPPYPAYKRGLITFKLVYTAKTKTFGWTAPWA